MKHLERIVAIALYTTAAAYIIGAATALWGTQGTVWATAFCCGANYYWARDGRSGEGA